MYVTMKQQLVHLTNEERNILKELCHYAKNLTNQAIYNIKQEYSNNKKHITFIDNYHALKNSENFNALNTTIAVQVLRDVDDSFKSFFALTKKVKNKEYSFDKCKPPQYLPVDGFATLTFNKNDSKKGYFSIPYSREYNKTHKKIKIKIPSPLAEKRIKIIRIVPKNNANFFEAHYVYDKEIVNKSLDHNNALAIDIGINNLITAVTSIGKSFIIDGKKLKSIYQWYNKEFARLNSIKDKQNIKTSTRKQNIIIRKTHNQVNDYLNKATKYIIDYCFENNIGTIIFGYNDNLCKSKNIHKNNRQIFKQFPFGKLLQKMEASCQINNIKLIKQEESYTSKASFWDKDSMDCVDGKTEFSGKRKYRGLYVTKENKQINADINGALNIMRKSNIVDQSILYGRGDVDTPIRIRIT